MEVLYRLANDCPVAWPTAPLYPVDSPVAPLSSPVKRATSQSPLKNDEAWLRSAYLNALYGEGDVESRLLSLARSLRKRSEAVIDPLRAAITPLDAFDRKWRPDVLKTLDETEQNGLLRLDERARLKSCIEARAQPAPAAGTSREASELPPESPRETLQRLEIVEVKLQVLLMLEVFARRLLSLDPSHDDNVDPLLAMYIDRLVIHQALSGMLDPVGHDASGSGVELDDVQRYWRGIEEIYLPLLPTADVERIRTKLFTGPALRFLPSLASTSAAPAPSPFHHPTPDLRRLAQAVSDAAAANAASRVPESPTLAKLIANPSSTNGMTLIAPIRPFVRSRSTVNAASLQSRQVQMVARPPVGSATIAATARPHKRKAAEPERIPPVQQATASKVLVATPRRRLILAPETPGMGAMDDDFLVPDTPL